VQNERERSHQTNERLRGRRSNAALLQKIRRSPPLHRQELPAREGWSNPGDASLTTAFCGTYFLWEKYFSLSEVIYTRLVLPAASPPGTRDVPGAQWRECNTVQGDDCLCLWPDHRGVKSDACVFRSPLGRWSSKRSERPTPARLESWRMFGSEILGFWSAASACSAIPSAEAVRR
jgi:hypothetical protein